MHKNSKGSTEKKDTSNSWRRFLSSELQTFRYQRSRTVSMNVTPAQKWNRMGFHLLSWKKVAIMPQSSTHGKQDLCSSPNALWWILISWTSRKSRYSTITENYQLTELKNFSVIATNFTYFKTELVRRSKRKNYFKARFQIKRRLPRPFIHPILWGILLGRITAKLFPKQVCIFQRPNEQNPLEKWCMHAGKLHDKEHLVISVLENKYSTLFAKNNPSSKHSVPTMTTQSSTREISFPPVYGRRECMQNTT